MWTHFIKHYKTRTYPVYYQWRCKCIYTWLSEDGNTKMWIHFVLYQWWCEQHIIDHFVYINEDVNTLDWPRWRCGDACHQKDDKARKARIAEMCDTLHCIQQNNECREINKDLPFVVLPIFIYFAFLFAGCKSFVVCEHNLSVALNFAHRPLPPSELNWRLWFTSES